MKSAVRKQLRTTHQQRPQLAEVVLQRRAGQEQPMRRADAEERLRDVRLDCRRQLCAETAAGSPFLILWPSSSTRYCHLPIRFIASASARKQSSAGDQ